MILYNHEMEDDYMVAEKQTHAGRKAIPASDRKNGYLTNEQKEEIEYYGIGSSFSERCVNLLMMEIARQQQMKQKTIRVIDLFAGLGGIRLGFEQAMKKSGFETKCVFTSEIKKYAIKAYQNHFGNEKFLILMCCLQDFHVNRLVRQGKA